MKASVASSIASSASCATTYFGRESPGASCFHRSRGVDEDRHRGAEAFFDFGLVGSVGFRSVAVGGLGPLAVRRRLTGGRRSDGRRTARANPRESSSEGAACSCPVWGSVSSRSHAIKHRKNPHQALDKPKSDVQFGQRVAFARMREMQNGQSRSVVGRRRRRRRFQAVDLAHHQKDHERHDQELEHACSERCRS